MANEFQGMKKLDLLIMAYAWADRDLVLTKLLTKQINVINRHVVEKIEVVSFTKLTDKSIFDMKVAELKEAITLYYTHVKFLENCLRHNNKLIASLSYNRRQSQKTIEV